MVADGMALVPYQWQADVLLDATPAEAAACIPRTVGAIEERDGATVLRIGANELDWIARYLAGLPFGFEVTDPPELRDAVRGLGRQLAQAHRRRSAAPSRR